MPSFRPLILAPQAFLLVQCECLHPLPAAAAEPETECLPLRKTSSCLSRPRTCFHSSPIHSSEMKLTGLNFIELSPPLRFCCCSRTAATRPLLPCPLTQSNKTYLRVKPGRRSYLPFFLQHVLARRTLWPLPPPTPPHAVMHVCYRLVSDKYEGLNGNPSHTGVRTGAAEFPAKQLLPLGVDFMSFWLRRYLDDSDDSPTLQTPSNSPVSILRTICASARFSSSCYHVIISRLARHLSLYRIDTSHPLALVSNHTQRLQSGMLLLTHPGPTSMRTPTKT